MVLSDGLLLRIEPLFIHVLLSERLEISRVVLNPSLSLFDERTDSCETFFFEAYESAVTHRLPGYVAVVVQLHFVVQCADVLQILLKLRFAEVGQRDGVH